MYSNLKKILDERGITPYKLAKELKITPSTFYDWSKGRYSPKYEKLKNIADHLGIPVETIIPKDDQNKK